jgi:uncharacterized protein (DUF58 family)
MSVGEVKARGKWPARVSKFTYARTLAAALAYLMLRQKDAPGLLAFGEGVLAQVPARSRSVQLGDVTGVLGRLSPSGGTAVASGLASLPEKLRRRGLVAFVSDCLADPAEILEAMRLFRSRGHEVIVFQVLSAEERDFPFRDLTEFVDAETAERLTAQGSDVARSYLEALGAHQATLRRGLAEMSADFVELANDVRLDRALVDYVATRSRRRARA